MPAVYLCLEGHVAHEPANLRHRKLMRPRATAGVLLCKHHLLCGQELLVPLRCRLWTGRRRSPHGGAATADDAADNADDAAAPTTNDNNATLPRSMPLIKEADGGKGDDDDAPIALLLVRFIQFFCLRIDGPIIVPLSWSGGGGDMYRKSTGGVPTMMKKGYGRGSGIVNLEEP
jgi:hypothetical protein